MKIAIISDIHDHSRNLKKALSQIQDQDALICCGDLCAPFIIQQLGSGFARDIHIVFGNNDADRFRMALLAQKFPHIHLHGEYSEPTLGGLSFAIQHFDDIGRALARGGVFDVVCFGHNHEYETSQINNTLLINPGEIYGLRTGDATYALLDTDTRQVTRVDL